VIARVPHNIQESIVASVARNSGLSAPTPVVFGLFRDSLRTIKSFIQLILVASVLMLGPPRIEAEIDAKPLSPSPSPSSTTPSTLSPQITPKIDASLVVYLMKDQKFEEVRTYLR